MAKKPEYRGLELAMRLEDLADHMLVRGETGPTVSEILRGYAGQIRSAPDFGREITESQWQEEMMRLAHDLTQAVKVIRGAGTRGR